MISVDIENRSGVEVDEPAVVVVARSVLAGEGVEEGELGVALDEDGYIVMDEEGYTSIPGVFAAGDLTRMYTQQVASAVHAGAEAAQTMNYYLYADYQKNPEDVSPEEPRGADPENA
jgi:thioredoxin reductase